MEILTAGQKAAETRRKNKERDMAIRREERERREAKLALLSQEQKDEITNAFVVLQNKAERMECDFAKQLGEEMVSLLTDSTAKYGWDAVKSMEEYGNLFNIGVWFMVDAGELLDDMKA